MVRHLVVVSSGLLVGIAPASALPGCMASALPHSPVRRAGEQGGLGLDWRQAQDWRARSLIGAAEWTPAGLEQGQMGGSGLDPKSAESPARPSQKAAGNITPIILPIAHQSGPQ